MKLLVVERVPDPEKFRLRQEAIKRGHTLDDCVAGKLVIYADSGKFTPTIDGEIPLSEYDLLYLGNLGSKRWEWITAARYVAEKFGVIIVDNYVVSDKFKYTPTPTMTYLVQSKNALSYPKTAVVFHPANLEFILKKFSFPMIVKDSMVHQGKGIYKVENKKELGAVFENHKAPRPLIVREFIPNEGDIRVFVVGFRAIAAMKRIPKKGDFRSNISIGGRGELFDLEKNPKIRQLAEKAAKTTGIQIAGVDIIIHKETGKPYLLEVNDGPGFAGLEKYTGINVAREIIEYFESLL